jgi:hypothetical protein
MSLIFRLMGIAVLTALLHRYSEVAWSADGSMLQE